MAADLTIRVLVALLLTCPSVPLAAGSSGSSYLPVLVLHASKPILNRNRVPIYVWSIDYSRDARAFGPVVYDGRAEASVRGNTSFYYDKKSYRLELQTPDGDDNKVSILGMPAESDWVLYGCVTDASFLRTVLAHELWRQMGHYAVRWRFVEVFMILPPTNSADTVASDAAPEVQPSNSETHSTAVNVQSSEADGTRRPSRDPAELVRVVNKLLVTGTAPNRLAQPVHPLESVLPNSYLGTYVLLEKIKRGKYRVNISKLRPDDDEEPRISGGYILSKDRLDSGERGLMTGQEIIMEYVEPKEREITPAQRKWMAQYLADFEKALYSLNFRDPATGYRQYIEVNSFVDFHWMVEMSRNGDGYWFSQYMHKDRNDTLRMGPVWDWDAAFGNTFFVRGDKTQGWKFEKASDIDYNWYERLFEDPDFLQRYIDRWGELRTRIFATANIQTLVDRLAGEVKDAQARDAWRWRNWWIYPRRSRNESFDEEIRYLKDWIAARLAWIDTQEFPRPVAVITPGADGGAEVSFTNIAGRVFYTLDGSDPRAPGGSAVPKALEYTKPVTVPGGTTMTVRTRSQFGLWSVPVVVETPTRARPAAEETRDAPGLGTSTIGNDERR